MTDIQNLPYNTQEDTKYVNSCAIASKINPEADAMALAELLLNQEHDQLMNEKSE